jgi:UDP:flavonoid glycosyltransferase YjiC (YdhE family)
MSTIAIVPSDVISKRMLAVRLATLLTGAGHRVVMLVDEGDHDAVDDGFERRAIPIRCSAGQRRRRWRPVALWRASRDAAAALDTDALATVLAAVEPDLLIIDIEEWEALALALALPSPPPLAVLCSFFDPWPIAGLGPNDPGPAGGFVDRVRGDLRWPWMWFRMRAYHVRQQLVRGEVDRIAVSRALARRLGVRREFTVRQWVHPFAPRRLPMLVCNALELDIPHTPRPGVVHIGSLLDPAETDPMRALADHDHDLAAVVAGARAEGRPIVLCVFGTLRTGERTVLMRRIAEVARRRPDHQFVIGSTIDGHADGFDGLANVHVGEWIPQRALLTFAAAAFVHTGNATLHECVVARVPMLVHPFEVNDQPRNAARVIRHGIGALDGGDGDDPGTLAARLDAVIADDGIRRRIGELADQVTRYEREGVALAAVEDLLRASDGHLTDAARRRP